MGVYASVAGRYKLGGRISWHQDISNQLKCCQFHIAEIPKLSFSSLFLKVNVTKSSVILIKTKQ